MSNEQNLTTSTSIAGGVAVAEQDVIDELVDQETLVEEVSIDGMCGVY